MGNLIPFGLRPGYWGLTGKTRERAKAEYELSGYDLDTALAFIDKLDDMDYEKRIVRIQKKHHKIDDYEAEVLIYQIDQGINDTDKKGNAEQQMKIIDIDLRYNKIEAYDAKCLKNDLVREPLTPEHALAKVSIDFEFHKINDLEAEKLVATIKEEPWVGAVESKFNPKQSKSGFSFELDWNSHFIDMLRSEGYEGIEDEDIIEQWFDEVAMSQAIAPMDDEDEPDDTPPPPSKAHTKSEIVKTKDGKGTKYS